MALISFSPPMHVHNLVQMSTQLGQDVLNVLAYIPEMELLESVKEGGFENQAEKTASEPRLWQRGYPDIFSKGRNLLGNTWAKYIRG